MKFACAEPPFSGDRRAPRGARGLKFRAGRQLKAVEPSRPAWGAWIEMRCRCERRRGPLVAPRVGRVD